MRPSVLLFDEPLSALDLTLRLQLRAEIRRLHQQLGFSAIYVTHDQGEAMALSDRVAVMNRGRIEQIAPPDTIYNAASSEFVHGFVGESSCFEITATGQDYRDAEGGPLSITLATPLSPGRHRVYLRPAQLHFELAAMSRPNRLPKPNRLALRVETVEFLGDSWRYHLVAGKVSIVCDNSVKLGLQPWPRCRDRLGRCRHAGVCVRRPGENALGFWLVMAPAPDALAGMLRHSGAVHGPHEP